MALAGAAVGMLMAAAGGCSTDSDCNLNGRCGADGACACLAAWGGPACATLQLLPTTRISGLHAPLARDNATSSWGGSVAFDAASGRWQMFAAEMAGGCGIAG